MLKKIACPEQKLLIGNEKFDDFDLQGRCGKVKGGIMFVVEFSLREQKWLIGNENFDDFDLQGRCSKVKGGIMFVDEISLRIIAINIVLQFEKDWQSDTKDIDRKWFRLRTDGQTDGRTRWIQYSPHKFFI